MLTKIMKTVLIKFSVKVKLYYLNIDSWLLETY